MGLTNKIDPEPYFFRWKSVMPIALVEQKELSDRPCYEHRTCGRLIPVPPTRIPPKICPNCGGDTVKEAKEEEIRLSQGGTLLGHEEKPMQLQGFVLPSDEAARNRELDRRGIRR